ncbi:hypothetical protein SKAU_G00179600 [Synaphobranchus kaupii]|uniref:Uncharacterized protein n=1 Tax=Synaphobranchus kaupii TaxID=118154 RepID=A0A9Q1FM21_SYNKA|nr:hypothetical protein SKAU_G00179600 [Synaphobranchus kaupii]
MQKRDAREATLVSGLNLLLKKARRLPWEPIKPREADLKSERRKQGSFSFSFLPRNITEREEQTSGIRLTWRKRKLLFSVFFRHTASLFSPSLLLSEPCHAHEALRAGCCRFSSTLQGATQTFQPHCTQVSLACSQPQPFSSWGQ